MTFIYNPRMGMMTTDEIELVRIEAFMATKRGHQPIGVALALAGACAKARVSRHSIVTWCLWAISQ